MDDDELIAAIAGRDDTALRELFWRHAPSLATRLRALLPVADVEDVVQETFLAVWQGASRYRPVRPDGSAGAWLWGIARRQAALSLRRRGPAAVPLPAALAADGRHAGDPAEVAMARADLGQAVAALGPADGPEREVWRLLYLEDRPVAEVARLTGVPEGTVKSRAHRTRRLLRAALRGVQGGRPPGPTPRGGPGHRGLGGAPRAAEWSPEPTPREVPDGTAEGGVR